MIALIILMLCKGLDDEVTELVKSQSETIFYQNTNYILTTQNIFTIVPWVPSISQAAHESSQP